MKKLLLALALSCFTAKAVTTNTIIITEPTSLTNIINVLSSNAVNSSKEYNFLPGQHSFTNLFLLSVSPITNLDGYILATNTIGAVRWQFPPNNIVGTNIIITLKQLGTNVSAFGFDTTVTLYNTNGIVFSTNTLIAATGHLTATTNIDSYTFTNTMSASILNTNILCGSILVNRPGGIAGVVGSNWLVGVKIRFQN